MDVDVLITIGCLRLGK